LASKRRNKTIAAYGLRPSFHRDVQAGLFPQDWAGDVAIEGSFGERV
jgi:hypothetical protein